jgi:hypothetical protein
MMYMDKVSEKSQMMPCLVGPALAATCVATRKTSLRVYLLSVLIFLVGGLFAFIAPLIF